MQYRRFVRNHYQNFMLWNLILIHFIMCFQGSLPPSEETIYFDVVYNSRVIGQLYATRTSKDSKTYYQSSTTIETRIIKEIQVTYHYDVVFDASVLKKSEVLISVNDKPHAETITQWTEANYEVIKNNDAVEKTIVDPISYATIQLYFKEPKNITTCYSEQDGSFNSIIEVQRHTYKKINSKGNQNLYYYEKGTLKKAIIDSGIIKFEIIAKHK